MSMTSSLRFVVSIFSSEKTTNDEILRTTNHAPDDVIFIQSNTEFAHNLQCQSLRVCKIDLIIFDTIEIIFEITHRWKIRELLIINLHFIKVDKNNNNNIVKKRILVHDESKWDDETFLLGLIENYDFESLLSNYFVQNLLKPALTIRGALHVSCMLRLPDLDYKIFKFKHFGLILFLDEYYFNFQDSLSPRDFYHCLKYITKVHPEWSV